MSAAQLKAESTRRRIRALYEEGHTTSRIGKLAGVSYAHAKQIVEQIKSDEQRRLVDECTAKKLAGAA